MQDSQVKNKMNPFKWKIGWIFVALYVVSFPFFFLIGKYTPCNDWGCWTALYIMAYPLWPWYFIGFSFVVSFMLNVIIIYAMGVCIGLVYEQITKVKLISQHEKPL